MNNATVHAHFMLDEPAHCDARIGYNGTLFVTVDIDAVNAITLSGPPDVILAQLDAMRAEVGRVMAEAEGVTAAGLLAVPKRTATDLDGAVLDAADRWERVQADIDEDPDTPDDWHAAAHALFVAVRARRSERAQ